MDMRTTSLDANGDFSLRGICPHCKHDSVFIRVSNNFTVRASEIRHASFWRHAAILRCQGCLKVILGIVLQLDNTDGYTYEEHFPLGWPDETLDQSIPGDVAEDFREALRCQWVNAPRACVVMCRRALQTSAIALNAQGQTLVKQIEDLALKGIITAPLKDFAHEIRLTGNVGAHADDLAEVKEPDAEAIIEFTREYLDHVYVMPAKLKARRPKKAAAKKP